MGDYGIPPAYATVPGLGSSLVVRGETGPGEFPPAAGPESGEFAFSRKFTFLKKELAPTPKFRV
jgi:hypothetical protein